MTGKVDILKKNGTYNRNHESVKAEDFRQGIFFDAEDLAQVKYEMLRCVAKGESSVQEASARYGFSRQSYYTIKSGFEKEGLGSLIPKKTGPKDPYKLNTECRSFIDRYVTGHPDAKPGEINRAMLAETGVSVHDRTVSRYLSKKGKGSRS